MPCRDDRDAHPGYTPSNELKEINNRCDMLAACLCAILHEVEDHEDGEQMIKMANENGDSKILMFWKDHKLADEVRLKRDLENYSVNEINLLKDILNRD